MAKAKTRIYTVRGRWGFPFDMLRYDASYPTSDGAAALSVIANGRNRTEDGKLTSVDVELVASTGRITPDRWHSFGWIVINDRPGNY